MNYWLIAGLVLITYGVYCYLKLVHLSFSKICEDSKLSKFVWMLRTEVKRCDGGKDYVYGFKSKDNDVKFFVYLDENDPRVEKFNNTKELFAFVDYFYLEDYFMFRKDKAAFRMLGESPFVMVSGITCLDFRDLEIFEHKYDGPGNWTKIPISGTRAKSILSQRKGVNIKTSEFLYKC